LLSKQAWNSVYIDRCMSSGATHTYEHRVGKEGLI
jgi:hypothetical protein